MTAATSTGLTAWAAKETSLLAEYAPLSWIAAGLTAFLVVSLVYLVSSIARSVSIRARYNRNLYERSGFVDPMAKTFEGKRIFLADFCLPSDPYITGKTFINCEIVGPANLFLRLGNRVDENQFPHCDAVALSPEARFYNGITLDSCMFRGCSFKRITFMITPEEYKTNRDVEWLNWISRPVDNQMSLPGTDASPTSANAPPLLEGTAKETQP